MRGTLRERDYRLELRAASTERSAEKALHHTGAGGCDGVAGEREGSGGGPRDGG